jgi:hypothetical protein
MDLSNQVDGALRVLNSLWSIGFERMARKLNRQTNAGVHFLPLETDIRSLDIEYPNAADTFVAVGTFR